LGYTGDAGPKGDVGKIGSPGSTGLKGRSGRIGFPGDMGDRGAKGAKGGAGANGGKGAKGWRGLRGPQGEVGEQGPTGDEGFGGPKGETGPVGLPGGRGPYGKEGAIGEPGDAGPVGIKGYTGQRGRRGDRGLDGPRGPPGPPGVPGPRSNPFDPAILAKLLEGYPEGEKVTDPFRVGYHQTYYRAIVEKTKDKDMLNMFDLLDALEAKVDAETKPDGSRSFPALSCRDIQMCFPESKSGDYWVDPNGGSRSDAFQVHCDFTGTVTTCIKPSTVFDKKEWTNEKNSEFKWIGKDVEEETSEVMYSPSVSQWKTLRLSHRSAQQNVTYLCKNSPAEIKLMSSNNNELHASAAKGNRLNIIENQCNIRDGQWRRAVFAFSSPNVDKLPIRDIAVAGSTEGEGSFSMELGSVCFS